MIMTHNPLFSHYDFESKCERTVSGPSASTSMTSSLANEPHNASHSALELMIRSIDEAQKK